MKARGCSREQPEWFTPHANMRTDCYVLLAALLNEPPRQPLLNLIQELRWDEDVPQKMQEPLAFLNRAGNTCQLQAIADEFHRLFVGLGSGELVPYGSWYREKMIQSATLAAIRSDLGHLDIVRQPDTHESEDHAGALCEIMALISQEEEGASHAEQAAFFTRHVAPWMGDFFRDLQAVQDAEFYRAVGAFGRCFLEAETEYLQNGLYSDDV
jgi:TorA maturation chaperone TorD